MKKKHKYAAAGAGGGAACRLILGRLGLALKGTAVGLGLGTFLVVGALVGLAVYGARADDE